MRRPARARPRPCVFGLERCPPRKTSVVASLAFTSVRNCARAIISGDASSRSPSSGHLLRLGDDLVAPLVHLADAFIADKKLVVRSWVREHGLHLVTPLTADRTAAGVVWSNRSRFG